MIVRINPPENLPPVENDYYSIDVMGFVFDENKDLRALRVYYSYRHKRYISVIESDPIEIIGWVHIYSSEERY